MTMAISDNMTTAVSSTIAPSRSTGLDAGLLAAIGTIVAVTGLILACLTYWCGNNVIGRLRQWVQNRRQRSHNQPQDTEERIPLSETPTHSQGNTGEQRGSGQRCNTGSRDAAQHAADKCEKVLKKIYTTTGSYVQMLPWIDDDQKHIMDIYTKLQLEKDRECDLKGDVGSYSDVFKIKSREGHPINRAIFRGTPGIGKTTLFDKIAYDWATGATALLKRFKFVFVLKMRYLNQKSDLIDALFDQLLHSAEISKADLTAFITARAGEVLFLLDGFNEFMTDDLVEKNFSSILKTLNRKGEYKDCCAFVSTRPSHYDKLVKKCLIQRPFALVNMLGFSDKDIKTYAKKFYSDDHSKANGLLKRIGSSHVLVDLAKSPMLLLLMCVLWKESSNLPETMSWLYNKVVKYIFNRKTSMSPAQISNLVIGIGRIALDGLLSLNQRLSFEEADFDKDVLDKALKAGILTSERVVRGLDVCKNVYFFHKTFQEFCAGKYYQSLNAEETEEKLERFFRKDRNLRKFEYLLRFCCGDNQGPTTQSILHMLSNDVRRIGMLVLVLDCFFESQCDTLPTDQVIEFVLSRPIVFIGVRRDISASLIYFLDRITDQAKGGRNTYLDRVHKLDISCCHSRQFGERLSHYVKNMRFLSKFTVSPSTFNKTQIEACLDNKTDLQKLTIRPSLKPDLMPNQVELTVSDILHIVNTLNNMPKLVEVDLSWNGTLGGSDSTWSQLAKIKQIQKVKLKNCNLTEGDIPHIADTLRNMPNLVELDLSGIKILAGSGSTWSQLAKIKQILKVDLRKCNLTEIDIAHITDTLKNMPQPVELDLWGN
ncbi:NACHT, LRR and PYD domains-containing protein 3-like [Acanthaster planci]|uniref:NACHT, LRR and PYD domains-containing protein 3-like n=1 Tax=Acanthaster planci TaxID=133434 RepID=A0A8B8A1T4_ACAPL|nr:NACHT, LRR and PYD domains-containing protein 3-like [Acanthaster planci]